MKYHISTNGKRIASFTTKYDRDLFLGVCVDTYPDCLFVSEDEVD